MMWLMPSVSSASSSRITTGPATWIGLRRRRDRTGVAADGGAALVAAGAQPVFGLTGSGAIEADGDQVVDLTRAQPFDRLRQVVALHRPGLRRSLDVVHDASRREARRRRSPGSGRSDGRVTSASSTASIGAVRQRSSLKRSSAAAIAVASSICASAASSSLYSPFWTIWNGSLDFWELRGFWTICRGTKKGGPEAALPVLPLSSRRALPLGSALRRAGADDFRFALVPSSNLPRTWTFNLPVGQVALIGFLPATFLKISI